MDQIPVCNYEGSDYQTSFWDQGDRAYEDGAEAVALRRLLPKGGQRMLELGAGAGRNTPRYQGFEQIVLVDYSSTQLELRPASAWVRASAFAYVAADIYQLPFGPGRFDAATMIRTLHHMAEPRLALAQVRAALAGGATFILEYANKQNLKAILRYALRRQSWNPFSPEPVEFAPLNFDFHPATVRAWLQANQFLLERQLTVSHYRMDLFKRIIPLRMLVWMDSLAQLTGDLWQFSPSVFTRSRAAGPTQEITPELVLRCPACGETPLPDTPPLLTCPACGKTYPVENGIYDLRVQ